MRRRHAASSPRAVPAEKIARFPTVTAAENARGTRGDVRTDVSSAKNAFSSCRTPSRSEAALDDVGRRRPGV